ncbi:MAG: PAS domain S-box protein [Candidatus Thiodiazotropha sp.]
MTILIISLLLQIVAVYFALRLIRITDRSLVWSLIAAAIALMAVRRGITLGQIFLTEGAALPDLSAELVALVISILMAIGIERITPIITHLQEDSRRLSDSETRYRLMFENSPVPIWEEDFSAVKILFDRLRHQGVVDLEGYLKNHPRLVQQCLGLIKIVDVNRAAIMLHRAESREALMTGLGDTFTDESFMVFREELIDIWRGRTEMRRDAEIKTLDGELIHVNVEFAVCPGFEASLSRVYVSMVDITERRRVEQALQLQEQEFRTLVEHSPNLIVRHDTTFRRTYVNPAWEKVSGLHAKEVINIPVGEIPRVPQPVNPQYQAALQRALMSGTRQAVEFIWTNAEGRSLYLQYTVIPEFDAEGNTISLLAIGHDITALKQAEQERRIHTDFLADMDRINRIIQTSGELNAMMRKTLLEVLEIFACERATLIYPCDPDSPTWRVAMECSITQWPGEGSEGEAQPMSEELSSLNRGFLKLGHPQQIGVGTLHPIPIELQAQCEESALCMALHPKNDKPWGLILFRCQHEPDWRDEEINLFEEVSGRLADGMSSLLVLRDLRESEARYRRIFDTAREGIWGQDEQFITSFVNAHMAEILGCTREEMLGRPVADFLFPEDLPDHEQKTLNRKLHLAESYERRLRRKDGEMRWVLISATPVLDESGGFRGSFAMVTDITERKRTDQVLQQRERFSQSLLRLSRRLEQTQSSGEVVAVAQDELALMLDFRFLAIYLLCEDKSCFQVLEKEGILSDAIDKNSARLPIAGDPMLEEIARSQEIVVVEDAETDPRTNKALVRELKLRTLVNVPIFLSDQRIGSISTGTHGDQSVHHLSRPEQEYLTALASHLAVTLDRIKLLAQRQQVESELRHGNRGFDLQGLVREMVEMLHPRAREKGLQIVIDQDSEFPRYVHSDEVRLRQILLNLLSNAVKFTERGGVILRVSVSANGQQPLRLEIEDTGPGINAADQARLFQPFARIGDGSGGLGLSIVQQYVHVMGGVVQVESEPGKGSLFRVELPLEPVASLDMVVSAETGSGERVGLAPEEPRQRIVIAEDPLESDSARPADG